MSGPLPTDLLAFVESVAWTFAKTYAATWPHEYIVRDRVVEERLGGLDRRITALDQKFEQKLDMLAGRLAAVETEVSRNLRWTVSLQVTTLLAVIAAVLGR